MCLIAFSFDHHPDYRLIFAANRDEFYGRPTAPADFWDDAPHVLAGRDLEAGGTWMGVTRTGRWAAVTNYRDLSTHKEEAPSRGQLVADYLQGSEPPRAYLEALAPQANRYNGFSLLVGSVSSCLYFSNREGTIHSVSPAVHGLSNHLLDTPWPKVERGKKALKDVAEDDVSAEALLERLDDRRTAPDDELPDTGVGQDAERMLSPLFIESPEYGTRSSTVLLIDRSGQVTFVERTYERGTPEKTHRYTFDLVSKRATHET